MAFSKLLADTGHAPKEVRTKARLVMVKTDTGFKIAKIHLETSGSVDGIDEKTTFQQNRRRKPRTAAPYRNCSSPASRK